jgi:hypothetical protein
MGPRRQSAVAARERRTQGAFVAALPAHAAEEPARPRTCYRAGQRCLAAWSGQRPVCGLVSGPEQVDSDNVAHHGRSLSLQEGQQTSAGDMSGLLEDIAYMF